MIIVNGQMQSYPNPFFEGSNRPNKENTNNLTKISLFPNIVTSKLNTLFPAMVNSSDILFTVRADLKRAIDCRLHLFVFGNFMTVFFMSGMNDRSMFHSWLWIDSKARLHCREISPNTRLQHPHNAVFCSIVSKRRTHLTRSFHMCKFLSIWGVQHFLKFL